MNKMNAFKNFGRLMRLVTSQKRNIRYGSAFSAVRMVSTTPGVRLLSSVAYQRSTASDSYLPSSVPPPEPDVLYRTIEIEIRSSDREVLKSYCKFIEMTAGYLDITSIKVFRKKKADIKRWTVLKSVFVHKKHMVQYEVRTYHFIIAFERLTGSTADTFLEYVQRNLPEGVAMRVKRERLEELPEHLRQPPPREDLEQTFHDTKEYEQTSEEKSA